MQLVFDTEQVEQGGEHIKQLDVLLSRKVFEGQADTQVELNRKYPLIH